MAKPKRIMRDFRIDEISAVDAPAQKGARVVIMKRAPEVDEVLKHLPAPEGDESEKDFVARFMADQKAGTEFPEKDQRLAVAYSQLKRRAAKSLESDTFEKAGMLTSETDGHQHLVETCGWDGKQLDSGMTTYARSPGDDADHCHAWAREEYGVAIEVASTDGHTHSMDEEAGETVDEAAEKAQFTADERKKLADEGAAMPDGSFPIRNASDLENALHAQGRSKHSSETVRAHIRRRAKALGLTENLPESFGEAKKSATNGDEEMEKQEFEKRIASLEADLATAKSDLAKRESELAEAQKIAKMSRAERDAAEEAANPVVYKATDGTLFRKSDDPRLAAMAKRNDELVEGQVALEFAKRAEALKNLPGAQVAKVALLRAVAGISDEEVRKQVDAIVAAASTDLAKAFQRVGHASGGQPGSPVEKLNTLAKAHAEKHGVPFGKAYDAVLASPEGKALYAETTAKGAGV